MAGNRRRRGMSGPVHPAGSKLVRRFIRAAKGENVEYRRLYLALTGKEFA